MKICFDAGHGGSDPGAIGPSYIKEKDIVLQIVKLAGKIAKERGFQVIYTRTTDKFLTLSERAKIANKNNCDIFISIHCNAFTKESHGTETYGFPKSIEGKKLGLDIQHELLKAIKLTNRGFKTARFGVLRMTDMPAVLVETAFISNPKEEKLLQSIEFQNKIAMAIIKGTENYLNKKYPNGNNNTGVDDDNDNHNDKTDKKQLILDIQKFLNEINITDYENKRLIEDGIFGARTKAAYDKLSSILIK